MTSINSTSSYFSNTQLYGNNASTAQKAAQNVQAANASKARSGYGTNANASSLQSMLLGQTLGSLGIGSNDSLSFADLMGLRDYLSQGFESNVRQDLRELGVGMDKEAYQKMRGAAFDMAVEADLEELGIEGEYTLKSDGKGGINVVCSDDETRAAIEEYLAKNPDRVKEFNKIKNPSRADMVEYRNDEEEAIEKALREYLEKEGLNSKAGFNLSVKNGKISVTSSDAKVKAAIETYFKDNTEAADNYKAVDAMTKSDDVKFQLTFGKDGKPVVVSSHPDRDLIQNYFDNNPDIVKKFQQLDSVNTVDQARKAQNLSPTEIRKRIQMESLSTWFVGTGMSTSSIMDFSGGSTALMNGLNMKV